MGESNDNVDDARSGVADAAARCAPVTIEAFCEIETTRRLIEACARDRRLSAAEVAAFDGGLSAAIERYHDNAAPGLVIVESGMRGRELFEQLDVLVRLSGPETKLVVIGAVEDETLPRALAEAGVSDYLVPPLAPLALMAAISRLFAEPGASGRGKTVAFVSAKGRTGSSAIARHVAWCAAETLGARTAIVDLGRTAQDGRPTEARGERLSAFAAPAAEDDAATEAACTRMLGALAQETALVALDLPHPWPSWAEASVLGADEVVVTATPDLESLRNAKQIFDLLRAARPNDPPPRLVLNQVGLPRPEIPEKSFASFVGVEPSVTLAFEPAAFARIADGLPTEAGEGKVADALLELAAALLGREPPPRKRTLVQRMLLRA